MKTYILPAIKLTLVFLVVFAVLYPMAIWAAAQFSAGKGEGEVVKKDGKVVGYERVGQEFKAENYFHGRPSAVKYNSAGSGGSNKGPSNPEYLKDVQGRIDTFLMTNPGIKKQDIPVELVTASGSGLDPELSPAAALVQVPRVAKLRALPEEQLKMLISQNTFKPYFGPAVVNVLKLNVALDGLKK